MLVKYGWIDSPGNSHNVQNCKGTIALQERLDRETVGVGWKTVFGNADRRSSRRGVCPSSYNLVFQGSAVAVVQELLDTRYSHLFKSVPSLLDMNKSFCDKDLLPFTREGLLEEMREPFEQFIKNHVQLFSSAKNVARRTIWLHNFCEQLALTVAGNSPSLLSDRT